jgi:hypothetical protein
VWINKFLGGKIPPRANPPGPSGTGTARTESGPQGRTAPGSTSSAATPVSGGTQRAWPGHEPKGKEAAPPQPRPSGFGGVIDTTRPPPSAYLRPSPGRDGSQGEAAKASFHPARNHPMPDAPEQAFAPGNRPGPQQPPRAEVRAQLMQMSQNTLPQPDHMRAVTRTFQSADDPRLQYGSVVRPGTPPDLQSRARLEPRRDSISPEHNDRLDKAVKSGTAALQTRTNGEVKMQPHVKAGFQLFEAQRKDFVTNPAYAHIPNRDKLELANFFGLDPKNPNRVIALGTGPGPGGAFIGSEHETRIPRPTDPRVLMVVHDHNHGGPNSFSRKDFGSASRDGAEHGVPTYGLVNRNPADPLRDKEYALTNGRVETTAPNGRPTLLDRPTQFTAVNNPDAMVGTASNDLRSIPFSVKGERHYQVP